MKTIRHWFNMLLSAEFIRFAVVGVIATGIHYGLYLLLDLFIPANPAYAAGYAVSFVFNYLLSALFTFRRKASLANGVGFGFSHLVNFALHMLLLNAFLLLGVKESLAPIPVYCICVPVNFILVRFVFRRL